MSNEVKVKEIPFENVMILPPKPGVCRECAVDHRPDQPHNRDSLYYQMKYTIDAQQRELTRVADDGRAALQEAQRLRRENANLSREIEEQNELIEDAQRQYDFVRSELLSLQSVAAKGDAERVPVDELTIDVFASAVRQFIGTCARMPHMGHTFGTMTLSEKNAYDELLRTVEGWAANARQAMNTIAYEEVEIHG